MKITIVIKSYENKVIHACIKSNIEYHLAREININRFIYIYDTIALQINNYLTNRLKYLILKFESVKSNKLNH